MRGFENDCKQLDESFQVANKCVAEQTHINLIHALLHFKMNLPRSKALRNESKAHWGKKLTLYLLLSLLQRIVYVGWRIIYFILCNEINFQDEKERMEWYYVLPWREKMSIESWVMLINKMELNNRSIFRVFSIGKSLRLHFMVRFQAPHCVIKYIDFVLHELCFWCNARHSTTAFLLLENLKKVISLWRASQILSVSECWDCVSTGKMGHLVVLEMSSYTL